VSQTFSAEVVLLMESLSGFLAGSDGAPPDYRAARDLVHKLKGSALTLGAAGVGECCSSMREALVAGAREQLGGPASTRGSYAALQRAIVEVQGAPRYCGSCATRLRAASARRVFAELAWQGPSRPTCRSTTASRLCNHKRYTEQTSAPCGAAKQNPLASEIRSAA
jgi:HPt (histidine-containing phosphotransfer) domain-containing protein